MMRWLALLGFALGMLLAAAPPACSAYDKSLHPDEDDVVEAVDDTDEATEPGITVETPADSAASTD